MDEKTLTIIAIVLVVLVGALIYFSFSENVESDQEIIEGGPSQDSSSESQYGQIPPPPALP